MKPLHGIVSFAFMALLATGAKAQTADEVINKHIEAIGGADAWRKITSVITEGSLQVQGTDVTVVTTSLLNKGLRQDINAMGMAGYVIITPTAGWRYFPFQGQTSSEPLTADEIKDSQAGLDPQGVLLDYKTKGHTVEYQGTEKINGADCHKLKVTLKSGGEQICYIDAKTNNLVRISRKMNGQDQFTDYSGFEKLPEGIVVAKTISLPVGDVTLSKVQLNPAVDENIFKPTN